MKTDCKLVYVVVLFLHAMPDQVAYLDFTGAGTTRDKDEAQDFGQDYQAAADAAKLLRAHRDVRTAYVTREAFTVDVA